MIVKSDATKLWIGLLTVAALVSTLALACATPFAALAAIAAFHMRQRSGVAMLLLVWVASQAVGFGLLGYPCTLGTLVWGVALGTAAVAAVLAASHVDRRVAERGAAIRLGATFLIAFVAFKLIILLWSFGLGGTATVFAPHLLARQIAREAGFVIGLELLYRALTALGVPAVGSREAIAA